MMAAQRIHGRTTQLTHDDYTVGWICPLVEEVVAARAMLDVIHPRLGQSRVDANNYTLGSIIDRDGNIAANVVIATMPTPGNTSAATVVAHMVTTFPNLRFNLLVGIGGGVPTRSDAGPIRLGHVVVSCPTRQHSGAVQYDHGKAQADQFVRTGALRPPPSALLSAAINMDAYRRGLTVDPLQAHLRRIDTRLPRLRQYRYPGAENDHLYQANYAHTNTALSCQNNRCDPRRLVNRSANPDDEDEDEDEDEDVQDAETWVTVHSGTVASGELVMRDGEQRDTLASREGVLCFEMEAAGAMNHFPCLVIRGISDYADSHKSDRWKCYAAAVAAAYARELFFHMPIYEVARSPVDNVGGRAEPNANAPFAAVARTGSALQQAISSNATRRGTLTLIVNFEDAMIREMRSHAVSANWANDSNVKFYCNTQMNDDPIPRRTWNFMVAALEKNMSRMTILRSQFDSSISREDLFGGFDANALRSMD